MLSAPCADLVQLPQSLWVGHILVHDSARRYVSVSELPEPQRKSRRAKGLEPLVIIRQPDAVAAPAIPESKRYAHDVVRMPETEKANGKGPMRLT